MTTIGPRLIESLSDPYLYPKRPITVYIEHVGYRQYLIDHPELHTACVDESPEQAIERYARALCRRYWYLKREATTGVKERNKGYAEAVAPYERAYARYIEEVPT
jgi:endonuclease YncB( thermonuclease family)